MANKAFGRAVLAASILGTGAAAHAGPDGWGAPTVVAQAQTSPEAEKRAPQAAPAQPRQRSRNLPPPLLPPKSPPPGEPQPGAATPSPGANELPPVKIIQQQRARAAEAREKNGATPGAVELPPVKIIQPQAPERPRPAQKAAPTPKRAPARIAAPAVRPQQGAADAGLPRQRQSLRSRLWP